MEKTKDINKLKESKIGTCKAEADEVKNMMLVNAINEKNLKKKKS